MQMKWVDEMLYIISSPLHFLNKYILYKSIEFKCSLFHSVDRGAVILYSFYKYIIFLLDFNLFSLALPPFACASRRQSRHSCVVYIVAGLHLFYGCPAEL